MKKNIFRIGAFILDAIFVSLVCLLINYVPFLNPNKEKIEKYTKEETNYYQEYLSLQSDISDYTEDDELSSEEISKLREEYELYSEYITDLSDDTTIDDYTDNLQSETYEKLTDEIKVCNYKISKYSWYQSVISIVIYVLYFGVLQYLLKGQTLFKKLFKLRVVNKDDDKKEVPLWNYIVRSLLISESIFVILDIIFVKTFGQSSYLSISTTVTQIRSIYELAFLLVVVLREDGRGIQDFILNTKIVRYNKDGEIISDVIDVNKDEDTKEETNNKEEEKKVKNTSKKTTTKKSTSKKTKEVVKAEKIDD